MHILLTGATGLIGTALVAALSAHQLTVLTRSEKKAASILPKEVKLISSLDEISSFDEIDAVINLAGEPIINKRWTEKQKGIICSSRWDITRNLVDKINAAKNPPSVFISGSAVGIYGEHGEDIIDEQTVATRNSFAHSVCENWEKIALNAQSDKTRVCLLRTGIVLSDKGGAIQKMFPSFWLGLGGKIASGTQYFPWIHIEDVVQSILFLLNTPTISGAVNLTAPTPVPNKEFARAFASALNRPSFFFVPAIVIKLTIGEGAELLLESQRVVPTALLDGGYQFRFPDIDNAMQDLLA